MSTQRHKSSTRRQWVWIMLMVNIVFVLLLMTLGIIALRVGDALPEGTDILFVVGKRPSVTIGDDGKAWQSGKNIALFQSNYVNGQGQTTVASNDGTKLFAPGTSTKYSFAMQNDGNVAVVYSADIDFVLTEGGNKVDSSTFPMKVRLYTADGTYLIGDQDNWVAVTDATATYQANVLGASSYQGFTLELKWDYEGGSDQLDTQLGNLSASKGVGLNLQINTYAYEADDATLQGGIKVEVDGGSQEYGGTIRWLWLVLLMSNAAVLVFYVAWLLNKRAQDF